MFDPCLSIETTIAEIGWYLMKLMPINTKVEFSVECDMQLLLLLEEECRHPKITPAWLLL